MQANSRTRIHKLAIFDKNEDSKIFKFNYLKYNINL